MSAAVVRKALELSSESEKPLLSSKSRDKKAKSLKDKKKKKTPEQIQKQNLKFLKALEYKSKTLASSSKTTKKGKPKTAFTDEDFQKFEKEYFVRE